MADGGSPGAEPPQKATLRVTRGVSIPLDELRWRFSTSGGPGGQHANRAATRAEVRFDAARSPSLGPRQRARIVERLGPTVQVAASSERSQARNRQLALERLAQRLAAALSTSAPRVPTRPSRAAGERRLEAKRRRSQRIAQRRRPDDAD